MNPIVPEAAAAAPEVSADPRDQWTGFTVFWASWALSAAVVEAYALYRDKRSPDRRKRTLSSNTRRAFAWDSISGNPVHVPYGRVRRSAFVMLTAWFGEHIRRNGGTKELKI